MSALRITAWLSCVLTLAVAAGCESRKEAPKVPPSGFEKQVPKNWLFPEELAWLGPGAAKRANEQLACGLDPFAGHTWMPSEMQPDRRLRMRVVSKDDKLIAGKALELEVTLSNISSRSLYVNTGQPFSGFQCRIFDSDGKFYWGYISQIQGSFGPLLREHFVEIEPSHSTNLSLRVKAIKDFDSPKSHSWAGVFPGRFLLTLTYSSQDTSYYDKEERRAVELPNVWTGRIISNSIELEVQGKQ